MSDTKLKKRKLIIAVIGDHSATDDVLKLAFEVGQCIGKSGADLICGGYGGVMEEAAKGAKNTGGRTIGILSGKSQEGMSDAIDIPIVTGMRDARNVILARTADGVIAVGGAFGTLSEISFALLFKKPLVGIKTWKLSHWDPAKAPSYPTVDTAARAVDKLMTLLRKS